MTDISGEIVDDVLTNTKSPFSDEFFPEIETSKWEKVLHNTETGEYLRINTDDLILNIKVDHDFDIKFEWIKLKVIPYFKNHLFHKYNLKNIRRFGVVFAHEISPNDKLQSSIAEITGNEIATPNQISVSFSKKTTSSKGRMLKGVNDYKNRIYSLQEAGEVINANLDCQYYYDPIVEDLRECFAEDILDDARDYLGSGFHTWLSKYAKEDLAI